jgi:hypothetical protein
MARYREKDETDLRWNHIRRRITSEMSVQIAEWKERQLNKLLSGAWEEYTKALDSGEKLALETHYSEWVAQALGEAIGDAVTPRESLASVEA